LQQAAAATGTGIPGVMPTVWPIARFEVLFGMYALLIAGLLDHPALSDVVQPHLDEIRASLTSAGFSFSDHFAADGDDTAAALAVLSARGEKVDLSVLRYFEHDDHYCTWRQELQPSLSATARAVHVLSQADVPVEAQQRFLLERQREDGRWAGDKWNSSWLYATWHAVLALQPSSHHEALAGAWQAVLNHQHADGGWGLGGVSNATETAYGVGILHQLQRHGYCATGPLAQAQQWLLHNYRPFAPATFACWLGKEVYRPLRVDRVFELVAAMVCTQAQPVGVA
jgi:hypothetical protein